MTAKAYKLGRAFDGAPFLPYLYAAYGMNTARSGMMGRCPMAEPAGTVLLRNHKLVFRGVADVTWSLGRQAWLALWWFTEDCERSLDSLEGFRRSDPDRGLYGKRYFRISGGPLNGRHAMIYVMNGRDYVSPPSEGYEHMLRQGYADFGMPALQIDRAIAEAKAEQKKNYDLFAKRAPKAPKAKAPTKPVWTPRASEDPTPNGDDDGGCDHVRGERSVTRNGNWCARCGEFMPSLFSSNWAWR